MSVDELKFASRIVCGCFLTYVGGLEEIYPLRLAELRPGWDLGNLKSHAWLPSVTSARSMRGYYLEWPPTYMGFGSCLSHAPFTSMFSWRLALLIINYFQFLINHFISFGDHFRSGKDWEICQRRTYGIAGARVFAGWCPCCHPANDVKAVMILYIKAWRVTMTIYGCTVVRGI